MNPPLDMKYITTSPEQTEKIGEEFAKKLQPQDVVFLTGELGSGKTTFTKGLAKGLGITTRIISPTFVIVRSHATGRKNLSTLYHLDLYRLDNEKDALEVNLSDYLDDPAGVVVIEWPDVSQNIVKRKVWNISFLQHENKREIEIPEKSA